MIKQKKKKKKKLLVADAPAVDFPPSLTPRVHRASVLDSPVSPAPVHELSRIFPPVSIQSTADDESARTPDISSPLKVQAAARPSYEGSR